MNPTKAQRKKHADQIAGKIIQQRIQAAVPLALEMAKDSPGKPTPSPKQIVAMQDFATRWKKRNPTAGKERLYAAMKNRFNLEIDLD